MAESFTSYSVDNDKKFREALKRASEVSQDLRVPFGLILSDFYKSEAAIFKLQGPGKYPPFKHSKEKFTKNGRREKGAISNAKGKDFSAYQWAKLRKYGFDYPLLVRTGKLSNSLLGPNNDGSVSKITPLSLTFGTSIKYGIYHQSDEPRSKMPLRKFLFIGPEAPQFASSEQAGRLQRWNAILESHIQKQIKKEGF